MTPTAFAEILPTSQSVDRAHLSPEVVLSELWQDDRRFLVARDDLLPGGTKQRACVPLLEDLAAHGYRHFVYASPFCGFAQVALAYACSVLKFECQIFCEVAPTEDGLGRKHPFTHLAESYGAEIHLCSSLTEAEKKATDASAANSDLCKIPLGFNCAQFKDAFERELRKQWRLIEDKTGTVPRALWLPIGSGTLASVFSRIIDSRTKLKCIDVRVLAPTDERIKKFSHEAAISFFSAPETFHAVAQKPPSLPSNVHYDAKIWRFLAVHGNDGDLWWNVAR